MKIGIYGGTFNPPHLGHVTAARAVFELLKLDKLLLVPAGLPPHKDLPAGSPTPEQRLEMTRLAADQTGLGDRVEVLDLELRREGRSYTSDKSSIFCNQVICCCCSKINDNNRSSIKLISCNGIYNAVCTCFFRICCRNTDSCADSRPNNNRS